MSRSDVQGDTRSLRSRLLVALLAPVTILFALSGTVSFSLAKYFADSVYDGWLFDSASSLAQEVEYGPAGPSVDIPASVQRLFEWDVADKTYFRIVSEGAGVIAGRARMPPPSGDVHRYRGSVLDDMLSEITEHIEWDEVGSEGGAIIYDGELDGEPVRIASLRLPPGSVGGEVRVEVAETTRKRRALAQAILVSSLVPQVLLIGVATLAVWRGVSLGIRPLNQLADKIRARSHLEMSPIADPEVPLEIRPLSRALNELLGRLHQAMTLQRRFVAEAAHQLRTPLTAIKLDVENLQRENPVGAVGSLIGSLAVSTDRAVRLSNQLLSLARAEPDGTRPESLGPVDLDSLARETCAEWAPRALRRGLDIQYVAPDTDRRAVIHGDADLLREALSNLLDNAIKYTPPPGHILVEVHGGRAPSVSVEDDGPGIDPVDKARMMKRFVRGTRGEGSGLGLAIALEIARLHRGDLCLSERDQAKGLKATLSFRSAA